MVAVPLDLDHRDRAALLASRAGAPPASDIPDVKATKRFFTALR